MCPEQRDFSIRIEQAFGPGFNSTLPTASPPVFVNNAQSPVWVDSAKKLFDTSKKK